MKSLVSIIIPCYNGRAFVGEAIESALRQTYPRREVIVIDDGSTDNSLEIIRSFGDAVRWQTGPNRGGCAARNIGIELARGQYVQFVDADDVLLDRKLERDVDTIEQSNADVCVSTFRVVEGATEKRCGPRGGPTRGVLEWVLRSDLGPVPLYRNAVLRNIGGFRVGLPCCQEFDLNLRLAVAGARFDYSKNVGYLWRRRAGSVSHDEVRLYRVMARVLEELSHNIVGESHEDERRMLASKIASAARWLFRAGDMRGGLEAVEAAKRVHKSAGVAGAYSPPARAVRSLLGPVRAEQILWWCRRLKNPGERRLFARSR